MPKQEQSPHFDALALAQEVHKQDLGLHVSTNDPDGFKRLLYGIGRAHPHLRCHIYASKASKRRFTILKSRLLSGSALEESNNSDD